MDSLLERNEYNLAALNQRNWEETDLLSARTGSNAYVHIGSHIHVLARTILK